MLAKLQRGLETLYRIRANADVGDFLIDEEARDRVGVARSPREQLLLQKMEDGWGIGLYLDRAMVERLAGRRPAQLVKGNFLGEFLMLIEGVSHFVYVAYRAERDHEVSALELELQAEVDKYVTCLLSAENGRGHSKLLRSKLYCQIEYDADLGSQEQERYRIANDQARRYSRSLERRYVSKGRIHEMLAELRQFYRMGLRGKMQHIRQAA